MAHPAGPLLLEPQLQPRDIPLPYSLQSLGLIHHILDRARLQLCPRSIGKGLSLSGHARDELEEDQSLELGLKLQRPH